MSELRIVGVRHHSPACARLVRDTIRELRPARVLIEGPADMTERLGELLLQHQLPIAIFSYYQHEERSYASWSPLCDYSPEWVAIREGEAAGAEVRFIDLPAWTHAFVGVKNRYSDRGRERLDYVASLCRKLGIDGLDALWDHLFEQPMETADLRRRLEAYFEALRSAEGGPVTEADAVRESFMARHIAYATHEDAGPVVVICGGFHAPALAEMCADLQVDTAPASPAPASGARHGSYLVPYSFHRLDAFTGYEAGMPSPAYYQALWDRGPQEAGERMLEAAVRQVRAKNQPLSAADLIAAEAMTRGLMRLRGHEAMSRVDMLDGLASAVLKDPLEVPLPWTERGPLRGGTDPVLVLVLAALSGKRHGQLAPETPRPPLVEHARAQLELHGLTPIEGEPREISVKLTDAAGLACSRVLHRLRVLAIPGYTRLRGPKRATDGELDEAWHLAWSLDAESALVEASAFGATLSAAAAARLEQSVRESNANLEVLSHVLGEALFVGLPTLAKQFMDEARRQARLEPHLDRLGGALSLLTELYRHDHLLGSANSPEVGEVIEEIFARGLWLFEGRNGPSASTTPEELRAVIALRDAERYAAGLDLDPEAARAVMERRAVDPDAPPGLRGAALGYLWSTEAFEDEDEAQEHAVRALRGASQPTRMGELLAGLFALAREAVVSAPALVSAIDELLTAQANEDFLTAVPSLRLAFGWFPPRERDAIASMVLAARGTPELDVARLRAPATDAETVGRALALEKHVSELEQRFGLAP